MREMLQINQLRSVKGLDNFGNGRQSEDEANSKAQSREYRTGLFPRATAFVGCLSWTSSPRFRPFVPTMKLWAWPLWCFLSLLIFAFLGSSERESAQIYVWKKKVKALEVSELFLFFVIGPLSYLIFCLKRSFNQTYRWKCQNGHWVVI